MQKSRVRGAHGPLRGGEALTRARAGGTMAMAGRAGHGGRTPYGTREEVPPLKKALQTILLTLLIAVTSLVAVLGLFSRLPPRADADPNALLARAVAPYLRDRYTFALADAYPDAWDTVQLVSEGEPLDPWTWRALRAFDAGLAERMDGGQLLVFWHGGAVARMVGFNARESGMPWFVMGGGMGDAAILSRKDAVFLVTLTRDGGTAYYVCAPVGEAKQA